MTRRTRTTDDTASNTRTGVATSREVAEYLKTTEVSLAGLRYKKQGPLHPHAGWPNDPISLGGRRRLAGRRARPDGQRWAGTSTLAQHAT